MMVKEKIMAKFDKNFSFNLYLAELFMGPF